MLVSFVKYEGAGNDFILIDDREELFSADARLIAALCDRHFGIGADGLMTLRRSVEMDCSMRYYNADGSPGEMCGNGARCFAAAKPSISTPRTACTPRAYAARRTGRARSSWA